jgi:hypothetical protein
MKYLSAYDLELLNKFAQTIQDTLLDRATKLQGYVQEMARTAALNMKSPDVKTLKIYDAAANALLKELVKQPDYNRDAKLSSAMKMITDTRALITTMMRTYNIV